MTTSPHYPQANGEVERAVQSIKNCFKKCEDEYLGMLMYRNTPLANGYSPAQLSMGRRLKTRVPCDPVTLLPQTPDANVLKKTEREYREKMASDYDKRHRVVKPESLSPGDAVWIPDKQKRGIVIADHDAPRSVIIQTQDGGILRRNRQMTRKLHQPMTVPSTPVLSSTRQPTLVIVPTTPTTPTDVGESEPVPSTSATLEPQIEQPVAPAQTPVQAPVRDRHSDAPAETRRSNRERIKPQRLIEVI